VEYYKIAIKTKTRKLFVCKIVNRHNL